MDRLFRLARRGRRSSGGRRRRARRRIVRPWASTNCPSSFRDAVARAGWPKLMPVQGPGAALTCWTSAIS